MEKGKCRPDLFRVKTTAFNGGKQTEDENNILFSFFHLMAGNARLTRPLSTTVHHLLQRAEPGAGAGAQVLGRLLDQSQALAAYLGFCPYGTPAILHPARSNVAVRAAAHGVLLFQGMDIRGRRAPGLSFAAAGPGAVYFGRRPDQVVIIPTAFNGGEERRSEQHLILILFCSHDRQHTTHLPPWYNRRPSHRRCRAERRGWSIGPWRHGR